MAGAGFYFWELLFLRIENPYNSLRQIANLPRRVGVMESSPLGRYCIDATEKRKLVSILMFIITGVCNGLLYFEKQIKVHIFVGFGEKMYLCTVVAPMCRAGCGGHPSPCHTFWWTSRWSWRRKERCSLHVPYLNIEGLCPNMVLGWRILGHFSQKIQPVFLM